MKARISRRSALGHIAGSAAVAAATASLGSRLSAAEAAVGGTLKGRIHHSVCKWCYPKISLEELCAAGKGMGLESIELLNPPVFLIPQSMGPNAQYRLQTGHVHFRFSQAF